MFYTPDNEQMMILKLRVLLFIIHDLSSAVIVAHYCLIYRIMETATYKWRKVVAIDF